MRLSDLKPNRKKVKGPSRTDPRLKLLVDLGKLRADQGVSVRACAEASGVDSATLWRIEKGGEPDLVNALLVAQFIGLPVEQIWALAKRKDSAR
jgi:transcriptional regulator with XRE-family HTH domain